MYFFLLMFTGYFFSTTIISFIVLKYRIHFLMVVTIYGETFKSF